MTMGVYVIILTVGTSRKAYIGENFPTTYMLTRAKVFTSKDVADNFPKRFPTMYPNPETIEYKDAPQLLPCMYTR